MRHARPLIVSGAVLLLTGALWIATQTAEAAIGIVAWRTIAEVHRCVVAGLGVLLGFAWGGFWLSDSGGWAQSKFTWRQIAQRLAAFAVGSWWLASVLYYCVSGRG